MPSEKDETDLSQSFDGLQFIAFMETIDVMEMC